MSTTWPAAPLGTEADLGSVVAGADWTAISSYVYQRAPVQITRGRTDESSQISPSQCTLTLNNRDNRFTIRNPAGAYYGLIGQNTPLRISVPNSLVGGGTYLRIEDDAESYASCPDTADLQITGNIDIRIDLAPTNYQPCTLAYKWGGTGTAWYLLLNGDGTVQFSWNDGTDTWDATSTQPLPYLGRMMIRAKLTASSGFVSFYTAATMGGSETQLGAAVSPTGAQSTSVSAAAGQPILVGHAAVDSELPQSLQGQVYEFRIYNSSATLVADAVFTSQTAGTTSWNDAQGNNWTTGGTAEISGRLYRYHGELSSTPKAADPSQHDVYSAATASGIMRRLQQGINPTNSALYRAYVRLTGSTAPVAYWPCEDGGNATTLGSALGGPAMTINGAPSLASSTAFACSGALPEVQASTWSGAVSAPAGTTWTANIIRFLLTETAGTIPNGTVIVRVYTSGTIRRLDFSYGTGGTIQIAGYDMNSSQLFSSGYVGFNIDGGLWRISLELTPSGGNVKWNELTLAPGAGTGLQESGTLSTATIGAVTKVIVNPNMAAMGAAVIGHLTVAAAWDTIYDVGQPLNAWLGETAGNRYARLCTEEGINCRIFGFPDVSTAMGYQTLQTIPELLQECESTDMGMQFEPRTCLGLGYVTRTALYNQSPLVTANYAAQQVTAGFGATADDLLALNDVTITNSDGSYARSYLSVSAMSIQSPPDGIGRVDTNQTVNAAYDTDLPDLAGWMLWVRTINDDRYPGLPFNLARGVTAGVVSPAGVPLLDVGSYLQITGTPAWVPPGPVRQLAAGFTETLGPAATWMIAVNCIPEAPYEVAVAGTGASDSAHADTDGSTLAAAVSSSATALSVVTTNPLSPVWTSNGGDFPFDILIAGERITVTSITPVSDWLTGQNELTSSAGIGTWTAAGNCSVAVNGAHFDAGTGSMAMTSAASGTMTAAHCPAASIATEGMPCSPGDSIECSAYFLAAATSENCKAGATFYQANGTVISTLLGSAVADNTSTWTEATGTVTAPALAAFCRAAANVAVAGASEVHYVNNVSLADVTSGVQQFTVTRSVNGVAAAQAASAAVALNNVPVAAL